MLSDRLGELEDRFFATVFLGSGFLFLVFAAVAGGIILAYAAQALRVARKIEPNRVRVRLQYLIDFL